MGLVVIGVAVTLVAVVAGLRPHLVPGAGRAAPVPGPPAVGDCVLDPLPGPPPGITVTATSGGTVPVYPAQHIQRCSGIRYGEIVSVIAPPSRTVVKDDGAGRAGTRLVFGATAAGRLLLVVVAEAPDGGAPS